MSDPNTTNDGSGPVHTGYDLESGMLQRVREWTDLFPWLRLVRTLRVAGSPAMVGLVALTFLVWWNVQNLVIRSVPTAAAVGSTELMQARLPQLSMLFPTPLTARGDGSFRLMIFTFAWGLTAWTPVTLYLLRQGALLTAGRDLVGLKQGMFNGVKLTPTALLLAAVSAVCVSLFALMILVAGWLGRLVEDIVVLEYVLALLIVLPALACGVLGFGAYVAVPLGWAALANERDPDVLDSLSRGYEYLYRRPLNVVLYALVSLVLLSVIAALASSILQVASWVTMATLELAGTSGSFRVISLGVLAYYPLIVCLTQLWALIGGVYLLLRFDAGDQEVEDLWQPAPRPKPALPELKSSTEANR